jgi:hypothetical protein
MTMGALSGQLQLSYKWPDQRRDVDLLSILFISFWLCSRIMSADFLGLYPHYITSVRWGFWVVDTGPRPPYHFFLCLMFQSSFTSCAFFVFFVVVVEEFCDVFNERISCGFPAHQKKKMFLVPRVRAAFCYRRNVLCGCVIFFFFLYYWVLSPGP